MKHSSLIAVTLMAALVACTPSVPSQYIQPDDLEDLLFDYYVAQAMSREDRTGTATDVNRTKYFLAVLKKYELSEADFDSSMVYYYGHAEYLRSIYARINERLADEAKSLGTSVGALGQYSQYGTTGDTANIWKEATYVMLMPRPTVNRFDFTVTADSTFRRGDSFMLQFLTEYLWQSGPRDAVVCIKSEYEGDSIIQTYCHVPSTGACQLRLPANRHDKLRRMTGFIYLGDAGDRSESRRLMFVSQLQLIRFHDKTLKNESSQPDSLTTDSIPRADDAFRPLPDSAGRRTIGRRHGGTPLLAPRRDALHRVDAREDHPKK
jgi:hypothetical protein